MTGRLKVISSSEGKLIRAKSIHKNATIHFDSIYTHTLTLARKVLQIEIHAVTFEAESILIDAQGWREGKSKEDVRNPTLLELRFYPE
jgi:hypothetical protein